MQKRWRNVLAMVASVVVGVTACDEGGDNAFSDVGTDIVDEETSNNTASPRYFSGDDSALLGGEVGGTRNEAKCSTCHSDKGIQNGFSGRPINDTAYLISYKNYVDEGGNVVAEWQEDSLLGAVQFCQKYYMGAVGTELLTEDAPEYQSLKAYIESVSDPSVTASINNAPEVLADRTAYEAGYPASAGDAVAGEESFNTWCGGCHTTTGIVMIPLEGPPVSAVPVDELSAFADGKIAQKVRTSGEFIPSGTNVDESPAAGGNKTPGPMPYFLPEHLTPEELQDIIAYIRTKGEACDPLCP